MTTQRDIVALLLFLASFLFLAWGIFIASRFAHRKQRSRVLSSDYKKIRKKSLWVAYFTSLLIVLGGAVLSDFNFASSDDMLTILILIGICPALLTTLSGLVFAIQFPKRDHIENDQNT